MKKRRKNFQASIDSYQTTDGPRWRVRARIDGKLKTLESGLLSNAAAEEFARGYTTLRAGRETIGALTLAQFGDGFLERREQRGVRGISRERNRWRLHVAGKSIGQLPLRSIARSDLIAWRDELVRWGLSKASQELCLVLVRQALADALDRDLVASNPAKDVHGVRDRQDVAKRELEGILTPDLQRRFLDKAPTEHARRVVGLALLTGLRLSELRELKWEDVKIGADQKGSPVGLIEVRYSEGGKAPKNGRVRQVELLEPAIAILRAMPRVSAWVVTGSRKGRPQAKKPLVGWKVWRAWRKASGIEIRWHDLRHTCATSLLAGWWGKRWTLEAVCSHLGHSSIQVTERYARKVRDITRSEARGMFQQSSSEEETSIVNAAVFTGANYWIRTSDLRVTKERLLPAKTRTSDHKRVSHDTDRRERPGKRWKGSPGAHALASAAHRLSLLSPDHGWPAFQARMVAAFDAEVA
jgi:integrase